MLDFLKHLNWLEAPDFLCKSEEKWLVNYGDVKADPEDPVVKKDVSVNV